MQQWSCKKKQLQQTFALQLSVERRAPNIQYLHHILRQCNFQTQLIEKMLVCGPNYPVVKMEDDLNFKAVLLSLFNKQKTQKQMLLTP